MSHFGSSSCRSSVAAVAVVLLLGGVAGAPAHAQERIAVDRWLVSTAFPADSDDPLTKDYLAGTGEAGVLPDRGRTVSGADWTLVREDSTWLFSLPTILEVDADSAGAEPAGPVAAYAHAYIRSTADRTVRLVWGGQECTRVAAWLNGRSVDALARPAAEDDLPGVPDASTAVVRIGFGYNTLLLKGVQGDCPFGLAAGIEAIRDESLEGVRVRASRPYGDTRTGPEQWIATGPDAGPETILAWREQELFGAAAIQLAAFSVTAIEGAELKAKAGGKQVKRDVEWLEPALPRTILLPFEFGSLRRAGVRGEGLELEIKWGGGEWKGVLEMRPEPLLEAFGSSIRLLGWSGPTPATDTGIGFVDGDGYDSHPLANLIPYPEAGETLVGEWKVPGWLSGFSLRLDTRGAPGAYRLASLPVQGEEIVLCRNCRKGEVVQIVVEATGDWSDFPGVVISDPLPMERWSESSGATAAQWLEWIDEKGSREYRERAAEAARGDE